VAALLEEAAARLASAGVASPDLDAELLLRHALGWERARLLAAPGETVPSEAEARFQALVDQRARRRPPQHLLGTQGFWRHDFVVSPDVLIPRPETELVVEQTLVRLRGLQRPVLVDVGTGSGCIALSLAAELPDAEVHATELSAAALDVARVNARRLGLQARVAFHEGDLLLPVQGLRFDAIVSNPPYVDTAGRAALPPEVRDHEPSLALFPPGDVLGIQRRLAGQALPALRPGGWLIVEVGLGQADDVSALQRDAGLEVDDVVRDLQGIPRTVVSHRPV
jgi:release factor glutamine methyltransferase